MTTHTRIATFLSTSALCLGLATVPAFAAQGDTAAGGTSASTAKSSTGKTGHQKHAKSKSPHKAKAGGQNGTPAK